MDEKEFKKHLVDLAHGHHHPEEHDWAGDGAAKPAAARKRSTVKAKAVKKAASKRRGTAK